MDLDAPAKNSIAIPKLNDDGSNWQDYSHRLKYALGSRGVIRHIDGTARIPQPYAVEGNIPVVSPGKPATDDQIEAREQKIDEYNTPPGT